MLDLYVAMLLIKYILGIYLVAKAFYVKFKKEDSMEGLWLLILGLFVLS